jgi:hypothetical protein
MKKRADTGKFIYDNLSKTLDKCHEHGINNAIMFDIRTPKAKRQMTTNLLGGTAF